MTRWDVLGLGAAAVDDVLLLERFPDPGAKMRIMGEQRHGGGLAATALVAAARLGARAAYLAVLGEDELSRFTVRELEREGVDCSLILRRNGARPFHSTILVATNTGERTILYSGEGVTPLRPEEIPSEVVRGCRVLFVDHRAGEGGLHALEQAQAAGIPVVADVEIATDPAGSALIDRADHLIVGIGAAAAATGEADPARAAAALAGRSRACAAVTAGDRGCWYSAGGGPVRHRPALRVNVVDTTGCGDVFHGAYAAALAQGEEIDAAIAVATVAAGIKATQAGGRAGIPDRSTVDRCLAGQSFP